MSVAADTPEMAGVIRELVNEYFKREKRDVSDIQIEKFDSGGANYTSALYKVVVTTAGDELHLFAKVASIGESMRESVNTDWIFQAEQYVYTKLAKIYDDIQQRHAVPQQHRFVFPKFYGCETEKGSETVLMEDLGARGYSSYDRFRPMDWEYASTSIQVLARFHALSFAYEKEYPEEFKKVTKDLVSKMTENHETMKEMWGQMVEISIAVLNEEKRERVRKIVYDEKVLLKFTKPVEKVVLVHGDYRFSNLLFKSKDDMLEVIPVDYQLVHSGCVVGDLLYMITVGSDQQFRAKYFRKLFDYYYEQLALSLERLSLDIVDVYPRETFDIELKKTLPEMIINGVMTLPAVTVDTEEAPKMTESFSTFLIKPNETYKERFNGIVDDCIEWGVI